MGIPLKIRIFVLAIWTPNSHYLTNLDSKCRHMNTYLSQAIRSQLVYHLDHRYCKAFVQDALWLRAYGHSALDSDTV